MRLDQFRQLAETFGGDIDRWPADSQGAARDLAASEEGARILASESGLDRLLAAAPDVDERRAEHASFAVLQKLAATADARPLPWFRRAVRWPALIPAASLACSAGMGVWLAGAIPYSARTPDALSIMSGIFDVYTIGFGALQ